MVLLKPIKRDKQTNKRKQNINKQTNKLLSELTKLKYIIEASLVSDLYTSIMKPKSRSTRAEAPVKFEAHVDGDPHDLMSRRKYNSVTRVKQRKAIKKQIYRHEKKLVESEEEKLRNMQKETERKKLWRLKKKGEEMFEPPEDIENKRMKETERKQKYRKKKLAEKEGQKA